MSEKSTGTELKRILKRLDDEKALTLESMGRTFTLAADAGDIIISARAESLDLNEVLKTADITEEHARRLERVAKHRPTLANLEPSQVRQLALWAGVLPDPITKSSPAPRKLWLWPVLAAQQWLSRKSPDQWVKTQKEEFIREAKPIVNAYLKAGGVIASHDVND